MVDEYLIGKDLKGSALSLIEALYWNLPGRAEQNQDRCCPGQDSNQAPPNTSISVRKELGISNSCLGASVICQKLNNPTVFGEDTCTPLLHSSGARGAVDREMTVIRVHSTCGHLCVCQWTKEGAKWQPFHHQLNHYRRTDIDESTWVEPSTTRTSIPPTLIRVPIGQLLRQEIFLGVLDLC
jgi:hypothetical protein